VSSGDGLVACNKRKIPCPFRLLVDIRCVLVTIPTIPIPQLNLRCLNFGHYRRHVGMNNANIGLQLVNRVVAICTMPKQAVTLK